MKTPRITDFDPDAKKHTFKSSLDEMPVIEKPKKIQQSPSTHKTSASSQPLSQSVKQSSVSHLTPTEQHGDNTETIHRPPDEATGKTQPDQEPRRSDRPTGKGVLVRRGFEWREDQLRALKKLSIKEQLEGKTGSMSQMVRDALDEYLEKRASEI